MNGLDSILVAKYIITKCKELNITWNVTKIQKLLYACHGVFLALKNQPLLKDNLVTLPFGPVDSNTLNIMQNDKDLSSYQCDFSLIPVETCAIIDNAINEFGSFSANQLVEWSHQEGSPWYKIKSEKQTWGIKIPNDSISEYFKNLIDVQ